MSSPNIPHSCAKANSASEEQSAPKPSALRSFNINGFEFAFTAKYSLKSAQAKAAFRFRAFSSVAFSS
jgi:hypothetical protein